MGAYTRARATVPFFGGTTESDAWARLGVAKTLRDWPQPSSISITFPWHTQGTLDTSADPQARGYAYHQAGVQFWRGGELTASDDLPDVSDTEGGRTGDDEVIPVDSDRTRTLGPIYSPSGQTYYGLLYDYGYAYASGGFANKARGTELFFSERQHSWMDYQDWTYHLPDGYYMTSCGR